MTSAADPARAIERQSEPAEAGDTGAGHAPLPGRSRRWWRTRRGLVWLGVAVVLVAGTVVVTLVMRGPGPDDVVREYLTAIQEGDVDKALDVAGADRPTGRRAQFLTADALSRDWRIVEVETTSDHVKADGTGWAQVDVVIAGPDGTAGAGGINLTMENGRWRLDEPLIKVPIAPMELSYLDVNGVLAQPAEGGYLMLPGFYRFYTTASDLVTIKPMTGILLQRWNSAESFTTFRPAAASFTRKGEDAVRKAVAARLADCATKTTLRMPDCPFGGRSTVSTPDGRRFGDLADVTWQVLRQPTVSLVDEGVRFRVVLTAPGTVQLSATGSPVGGDARTAFTVQCRIGEHERDGWTVRLPRPDALELERTERREGVTC